MKKLIPLFLVLILVLTACDLGSLVGSVELTETHTIAAYGVTVPSPEEWKPIDGTAYDLYLGNENETVFFGVFCYRPADLTADQTPADLFRVQNDQFLADATKLTDIRATATETLADRTVHSRICKGKNADGDFAYYFGLVELTDTLVWFVGSTNDVLIKMLDETFDNVLKGIALTEGGSNEGETVETATFTIDGFGITLKAPKTWSKVGKAGYDFELVNSDESLFVGVFAYDNKELADQNMTPEELFTEQNKLFLEDDTNVTTVREPKGEEKTDKIIRSATYTGEYDGYKSAYLLCQVELTEKGKVIWLCVDTLPSVLENNYDTLWAMVESIG
jgi:hypothetical protein